MKKNDRLLWFFLALALLLFLWRFLAFMRGSLYGLLGLGALFVLVWGVWEMVRLKRMERAFQRSPEGRMDALMDQCKRLLTRNQQELSEIEQNIREIKKVPGSGKSVRPSNLEESRRLLAGFEKESRLRKTRVLFYQTCLEKLGTLLHNQELARMIAEKKERLQELQENPFEELASMEEIKSALEMDVLVLDSISELSERMKTSANVEDAGVLQEELEKITRELERL